MFNAQNSHAGYLGLRILIYVHTKINEKKTENIFLASSCFNCQQL